jgi:hypothetical protein
MSDDLSNEKQVRLSLPPAEHEKLRFTAAAQARPIASVAREVLRKFIATQPVWRAEEPARKPKG